MATAHDDFHGADLGGVVALEGAGETQHHGVRFHSAELAQGQQGQAAERPLHLDAVVAQAEVGLDRAVHAAAAPGLEFAAELGQGHGAGFADEAGAVVEQVEVFELLGQGHGGALLRRGRRPRG
ncbi:hypothetical protein D9M71_610590 [compost metagenome]